MVSVLVPALAALLIGESTFCQPIASIDTMAAREAAMAGVLRWTKMVRNKTEANIRYGLPRDRQSELAEIKLGEGCATYVLYGREVDEINGMTDIAEVAQLTGMAYPVFIDDRLVFDMEVKPTIDSTTKKVIWRPLGLRCCNSLGKRILDLGRRYPEDAGYEMLNVMLSPVADFMIIVNGSDYLVFNGVRPMDARLFGKEGTDEYNSVIPVNEFLDFLKSYAEKLKSRKSNEIVY